MSYDLLRTIVLSVLDVSSLPHTAQGMNQKRDHGAPSHESAYVVHFLLLWTSSQVTTDRSPLLLTW